MILITLYLIIWVIYVKNSENKKINMKDFKEKENEDELEHDNLLNESKKKNKNFKMK